MNPSRTTLAFMSDDAQVPLDWPDDTRNRHILTTALLAIGVAPLVVLMHEYAHGIVQLIGGADSSTISAMSAEESGDLTPLMDGWAAAAGPLFSLVSGVVFWLLARVLRGVGLAIALWAYVASFQNMAGYLIITPMGVGDTATVVEVWGWPVWTPFVMLPLGVAGMFGIAALVAKDILARYRTVRGMRMAVHWPVLWASLVLIAIGAVLALGSGYEIGIVIAMITSIMAMYVSALMSSMYLRKFPYQGLDKSVGTLPFAAVFAVVAVLIWVFHAVVGVTIG